MYCALSETIRNLRIQNGMNQVELANKLNVSKQCVSNWENDNVLPSVTMLTKLADLFNTTTDYLLGRESENVIGLDDLTEEQRVHVRQIVRDLSKANRK